MKLQTKGLALVAAVALVVAMTSAAFAIESFQERFEWGDMSKPTTLHGRVIVIDPYDEAVWLNIAVFGGNAESGLWWQRIHPGKNLKFYAANKEVWEQIKGMARPHAGPAAAKEVPEGSKTVLVEFVAQETEQNHRVISSIKKIDENAGAPGKTRSISALRLKECMGKDEWEASCAKAKQAMNTAPKAMPPMEYDVLIPGGKPVGGIIPWTAEYNTGK
ncbi:hypothetical protein YTPLAS18_34850 [Nitrospira sp.]|nr:hypothetical protein YTPLAS18_34850 [Nitrospira sp.]